MSVKSGFIYISYVAQIINMKGPYTFIVSRKVNLFWVNQQL